MSRPLLIAINDRLSKIALAETHVEETLLELRESYRLYAETRRRLLANDLSDAEEQDLRAFMAKPSVWDDPNSFLVRKR